MYTKGKAISMLIVDDHPVVQHGLEKIFLGQDGIGEVHCFVSGKDTLQFLEKNTVDLVMLDINLPDMNGIDLCREIRLSLPGVKILAISNCTERYMITKMLQNGASGYILKNASAEELAASVRDVMNDKLVLSNEVQKILVQAASAGPSDLPELTRREREILRCIAEGMTTAQIAEKLFISPLTVETHRRNLMQKFQVNNAPALIRIATINKLI